MRRYAIALLLGLTALSAAACGEEEDGGVASAGDDATESASEDGAGLDGFEAALAYSECMRDNGVEEFPDPVQNDDGGIGLSLTDALDPMSEEFQAAAEACEELRPAPPEDREMDPEVYEALVEYSECMRENGIADFPDPEAGGGVIMDDDMGFDPQSEEFQAAQEACESIAPGLGGMTGTGGA
jgi:hypothetical protein